MKSESLPGDGWFYCRSNYCPFPPAAGLATVMVMHDGRNDFDFLFGSWRVRNRVRKPLSGADAWVEFESTATEEPFWDGNGNLERFDAERGHTGAPIHAIAVRLFDRASQRWSIYWSTSGAGSFGTPTVGKFEDGVGLFYDRETYEGRDVVVRFTWRSIDANACRWEQAYSADDGATWETNWTMDFARIAGG